MESLFPTTMVSGSVNSQETLEAAILEYPTYSRAFVAIALAEPKYRHFYEDNWPTLYKVLDKDFPARFRTEREHAARAWEFHLAVVLTRHGLSLKEKTWQTGPDFCITTKTGRRVWIEAIACDRGLVDPVEPYPKLLPGVLYQSGGNIEDIHRPRALRITSAIGTKLQQYQRYLNNSEQSGVSGDDCLVIAVNGRAIQHNDDSNMLFKYSVFGQGPDVYTRRPGTDKLQGPFYKPVPMIIKRANGKDHEIPTRFMEMAEFSQISAVLYCGHDASHSWFNGYELGNDCLFAYHVTPITPIPDQLFKFGRGIHKNVRTSAISDVDQANAEATIVP